MTHVLTTVGFGAYPPHTNARSSSNANAACACLPGDIAAFTIHTDPLYMLTDVGVCNPPMAYALPSSVTIARSHTAVGSNAISVHNVTPTFDCSHVATNPPPVVWPTIFYNF